MEDAFKRYELLQKDVEHQMNFMGDAYAFDFDHLDKTLKEMRMLQWEIRQNHLQEIKKTGSKFNAKKELAYMGTTLTGEGIVDLSAGFEQNVDELVLSFNAYNEQIADLASQTLVVINKALVDGYSEKEILTIFNDKFKHISYKSMKELISHYQTIGI